MKVELKNEFFMEKMEEKLKSEDETSMAIAFVVGLFSVVAGFIFSASINMWYVGIVIAISCFMILLKCIDNIYIKTEEKIKVAKESYGLFKMNALERIEYLSFRKNTSKIPILVFKDKDTDQEIKRQYKMYEYIYEPLPKDKIIVDFLNKQIKLSVMYIIQGENTKENSNDDNLINELDYI